MNYFFTRMLLVLKNPRRAIRQKIARRAVQRHILPPLAEHMAAGAENSKATSEISRFSIHLSKKCQQKATDIRRAYHYFSMHIINGYCMDRMVIL